MGLLDSILSQVTGGGQSNPLVNAVIGMVTNQSNGGLAGLVDQFTKSGLGQQAASWVGTGPNQPINSEHINQVFGNEKVQEFARAAGIDPNQAAATLAQLIPQIVDKLTPHGTVPQGDAVQSGLAALLKGVLPNA